jgi:hypothetical protein
MSCAYIRHREVKVIDGKEWFHDEEELLFLEPFNNPLAVIFYDYTDDNGENGTLELHRGEWDKQKDDTLREFPQYKDEYDRIEEYWRDNPFADILVCNVH